MALTYTEIEQQKNTRIIVFFLIVVLFYFLTALVLTVVVKGFLSSQMSRPGGMSAAVSAKQVIVVLLVAVGAAGLHIAHSMDNAMRYVEGNLSADIIDKKDRYHNLFGKIVDEVNVATGSKYKIKPVVIPTVALNAFSMADHRGNAVVGVTEGLLSKLTRQQLEAVVAHEIAHVASGDSLQTTVGCALFGIYAAMASAARAGLKAGGRIRRTDRGLGAILILILLIYVTLGITQFFYRLIRFALSRERELRADAVAVRLTRDPVSLAEALEKISSGWRGIGYIQRDLASLFIINPAVDARDEKEDGWSNLQSTHPPIQKRIRILAHMAHVSVKDIEQSVKDEAVRRERTREMPGAGEEPLWTFSDAQGQWQGPFTLSQAMVLGWLGPDTLIKRLSDQHAMQAKDEPLLAPVFDAHARAARVADLDCPACKKRLVDEEYEGVTVRRCAFCDGILVDWRQLPRIGMRTEKGFDERVKKLAEIAERDKDARRVEYRKRWVSPLKCPRCGHSMLWSDYSATYPVEVDRCQMCGLIWFEKNELETFQYMLETKRVIPDGWG